MKKKILFLIGFFIPFGIIVYSSWYHDPGKPFHLKTLGFNQEKATIAYRAYVNPVKAAYFGTSRTKSFTAKYFLDLGFVPAANYSTGGATIIETSAFFEHVQSVQKLDVALVELNYQYFNTEVGVDFSEELLLTEEEASDPAQKRSYLMHMLGSVYRGIFSFDLLSDSLKKKGLSVEKITSKIRAYKTPPPLSTYVQYGEVNPYDYFMNIIEIARKNKTHLTFYIPPLSSKYEEHTYGYRWEEVNEWKKKITSIVSEMNTTYKTDIRIWDFSGFNEITYYPFANNRQKNEYNINWMHFNATVAGLIFNRIYGTAYGELVPPDYFGVLLTPDTIDEHLLNKERERDAYLRERESWPDPEGI